MCVDVAKTARVTKMRLMPKLQSVFFWYFFGLAVMGHADRAIERTLSRNDPIVSCALGFGGL